MLIKFNDSSTNNVNLEVKPIELGKRLERATKIFFILLGLSIFSIAIPIFHFVLVPGFLIAAFVFAYKYFNQISYLDLTSFQCPKCSQPLNEKILHLKRSDNYWRLYCFNCRINMRLELKNED